MLQESMAAAVLHSDVLANGTGHRHCEERVVALHLVDGRLDGAALGQCLTGKRAPPGTRHQCRKSGTTPAAARMAAMLETDARTRVLLC